ncbi:MAG: hypothetical protein CM1200mP18_05760 [Gammaproteobacteria bacterium]|nr:MAG: hypothetical protein CM1200mP18_05760 [Gammaproteobacteria bacterium]
MHLLFGTISVRECFKQAIRSPNRSTYKPGVQQWLDELVWRKFYNAILEENPRVLHSNYRQEYDYLNWQTIRTIFPRGVRGAQGFQLLMQESDNFLAPAGCITEPE